MVVEIGRRGEGKEWGGILLSLICMLLKTCARLVSSDDSADGAVVGAVALMLEIW